MKKLYILLSKANRKSNADPHDKSEKIQDKISLFITIFVSFQKLNIYKIRKLCLSNENSQFSFLIDIF